MEPDGDLCNLLLAMCPRPRMSALTLVALVRSRDARLASWDRGGCGNSRGVHSRDGDGVRAL
jgi:hypothetical protein